MHVAGSFELAARRIQFFSSVIATVPGAHNAKEIDALPSNDGSAKIVVLILGIELYKVIQLHYREAGEVF